MEPATILLLLLAALLHAAWNAVLRSGVDRFASMTMMIAAGGVAALPLALWLPAPAPASWSFLATSIALQTGYCLFLVRAYQTGDLGQVYPIARGSSPLLVTLGAALLADERLGAAAVAGVVLVSYGIAGLAVGRGRLHGPALRAALATGAFIACYTVSDGLGARASGAPASYAAWLFVAHGAAMLVVHALVRGAPRVDLGSRETYKTAVGGVLSIAAYAIVVHALSTAPMGATSALRETSVLFAAILGRAFLGERLGPARVVSCVAIAVGAALLSSAR